MMHRILAWLFGLDPTTAAWDSLHVVFQAPWVRTGLFWGLLAVAFLTAASITAYLRFQPRGSRWVRWMLACTRSLLFVVLVAALADPALQLTLTQQIQPVLYVLLDGSESMQIRDTWTAEQDRELMAGMTGQPKTVTTAEAATVQRARSDYVRAALASPQSMLGPKLSLEKSCAVEWFVFDGTHTSQVHRLFSDPTKTGSWGDAYRPTGQVTALGAALRDLAQQPRRGPLAAVILVSDFAQNAGVSPLEPVGSTAPAERLGVPIHTIGLGPSATRDLSLELQPPSRLKRGEGGGIRVNLSQSGADGELVTVRLLARPLQGMPSGIDLGRQLIEERRVHLSAPVEMVDFTWTPDDAGRFELVAEVAPLGGESLTQNNVTQRDIVVIDDFLRLLYVAYEPSWEWRFVKEVFHRDPLIGMRGFRTYLDSSDLTVRQDNPLFTTSPTPTRRELFANDVVILGDMPGDRLSPRFGQLMQEFVGRFGGGLIVLGGPRFGPQQLIDTPIAEMLPVIVDPQSTLKDSGRFHWQLTPDAAQMDFMRLGEGQPDTENLGWPPLDDLTWYQPSARLHPLATALAVHPQDRCADGTQPQPLMAMRPYGTRGGKVVYFACDEMWRLRRGYGERYYRQFWSQLISYLGLSHALGSEKRFTVRTDRPRYRSEETVVLTVEAYDQNYTPLTAQNTPMLTGTWEFGGEATGPTQPPTQRTVTLPCLRPGIYEARITATGAGEHRIRVEDPVEHGVREVRFSVDEASAEWRTAVRDVGIQRAIAERTNGQSFEAQELPKLLDSLDIKPVTEQQVITRPLWATPASFIVVIALMLVEWWTRKRIGLP